MNRVNLLAFVATAMMAMTTPVLADGAFGVKMGTPISALDVTHVVQDDPAFKVLRVNVPTPNDEFDFYNVYATPVTGVCKVIGFGKSHYGDDTGAAIRPVYERYKTLLTTKYGKSTDFDYLHDGATLAGDDQFAAALEDDQRSLVSFWDSDSTQSLPVDLQSISLRAEGIDEHDTYLVLNYEFTNIDACLAQRPKDEDKGL